MPTGWLRLALAATILAAPITAGPEDHTMTQRQPVLVELFTSEGCSSCPPADALLEKLDRDQPIAGAQIIVLSEHVDYWNHDGWTDPFSSASFTARQVDYVRRLGRDEPYTPQMVVDGSAECNGSDARKVQSVIRQAITEQKVGIRIRAASDGDAAVTIEADPLPEGKVHKANVYLAYAVDSGTSAVLRGENRGRTLHHVSIVRDIQRVGSIGGHEMFKKQVPIRAAKAPGGSRLIAFVQEGGNGRVWGAAMYPVPGGAKP
ncbi:MAG: DUF1223 domain-containing protein [Bryobacteraceae bacterium]